MQTYVLISLLELLCRKPHILCALFHSPTNSWSQLSTDDPLAELQDTLFFRIVEEAFRKGMTPDLLPTALPVIPGPALYVHKRS